MAKRAATLEQLTRQGWEVVHQDGAGVQLRKRKTWPRVRLVLFVALPVLLALNPLLAVTLWYGPQSNPFTAALLASQVSTALWVFAGLSLVFQGLVYLLARDQLRYVPGV